MIEQHILEILKYYNITNEEVIKNTPRRVKEMYDEMLSGYQADAELNVQFADTTDLVLCKDIDFVSLCEHHLLPWYGVCHIAYIPHGKIVGASKLPKLVEKYAKRLQLQERFTKQIADELYDKLQPLGCMVVVEAYHMCMMARGVKKPAKFVTSALRGVFAYNDAPRKEVLCLL